MYLLTYDKYQTSQMDMAKKIIQVKTHTTALFIFFLAWFK